MRCQLGEREREIWDRIGKYILIRPREPATIAEDAPNREELLKLLEEFREIDKETPYD